MDIPVIELSKLTVFENYRSAPHGSILRLSLLGDRTVTAFRCEYGGHEGVIILEGGAPGTFLHGGGFGEAVSLNVALTLGVTNLRPSKIAGGDPQPGKIYQTLSIDGREVFVTLAVHRDGGSFLGFVQLTGQNAGHGPVETNSRMLVGDLVLAPVKANHPEG